MYGLLGERLSHSFSPQIHGALGDYDYRLFEVAPDNLEDFLKNGDFEGINVTIPYKKAVIPFLDGISREAEKIGSVNTVVRRENGLWGYNTDYFGFLYMLKKSKIDPKGKKTLVLGSGGASLTVKAVLEDLNTAEIITVSRNGENNYSNISKNYDADIIVNTTPLGMYPNPEGCAVDLTQFKALSGVLDIVYNPLRTTLIATAEKLGIPTASGLSMLIAQAVKANEIFFGRELPEGICEQVEKSIKLKLENITLVGMAGCGKTTVGHCLAQLMGKKIADTDEIVTELSGKTPAQLITEKGEREFRKIEAEAVKKAANSSGTVLATGGGAVTVPENYLPLHRSSIIVFINRSAEKLTDSNRPLSQQNGIKSLYESRLHLYREFADIEIDGNGTVEQTAQIILKELNKYENSCN